MSQMLLRLSPLAVFVLSGCQGIGLQLVPAAPWTYWGVSWSLIPIGGSLICWLGMLIVVAALAHGEGGVAVFIFVLTLVLSNGIEWIWGNDPPDAPPTPAASVPESPSSEALISSETKASSSGSLTPTSAVSSGDTGELSSDLVAQYEDRIADWDEKWESSRKILELFKIDRQHLDDELRKIDSSPPSEQQTEVRQALEAERRELARQIEIVEREMELLETAKRSAASKLRRLARRRLIAETGIVDDAEFEELSRIQRKLEDSLRVTNPRS